MDNQEKLAKLGAKDTRRKTQHHYTQANTNNKNIFKLNKYDDC